MRSSASSVRRKTAPLEVRRQRAAVVAKAPPWQWCCHAGRPWPRPSARQGGAPWSVGGGSDLREYKAYTARRTVRGFGGRFDYDENTLCPSPALPSGLYPLRARVARWLGVEDAALVHILVAEYAPGTPLGWRRDVPDFGAIAGVSLAGHAVLRFRSYAAAHRAGLDRRRRVGREPPRDTKAPHFRPRVRGSSPPMRDDLFCFEFMGRRVCVRLDAQSLTGWSYTIDGTEMPPCLERPPYAQRVLLEEAGMAAREHIRSGGATRSLRPVPSWAPGTPSEPPG